LSIWLLLVVVEAEALPAVVVAQVGLELELLQPFPLVLITLSL
jgi:hypothetical protein